MRGNPFNSRNVLLLAVVTLALVSAAHAAPKYKILHAFGHGSDGAGLWGSLAFDAQGNLYGMAEGGGNSCCGIVFELVPHPDGHWTEATLEELDCKGEAGCMPESGFVLDEAGNLYGMTTGGGPSGFGTVFELTPGSGGWNFTVLHDRGAWATLLLDQAGNLYGPMRSIGEHGQGAISELVKDQGWSENWIYSFCSKDKSNHYCVDGSAPFAGVIWGPGGVLYGTTEVGGASSYCGNVGCGVVFQLTPKSDGTWKETVLHSFPAFKNDGSKLYNGVTLDEQGNLYGATYQGGSIGCGVIFKLAPQANGKWKETILYDFKDQTLGCSANPLTFDAGGNLWGTAGGGKYGYGVVFELSPQESGKWKYSVVHQFNWKDGGLPASAVVFDNQGNLYGTTIGGGAPYYGGVVFEITP